MCYLRYICAFLTAAACLCEFPSKAEVVINEIMYQPASGNALEEYIELHNSGGVDVDLTGWRLSGGVDFAFPSNTIVNAGGFLMVAGNTAAFVNRYGNVTPLVGGYVGVVYTEVGSRVLTNYMNVLGNSRNTINLRDASGEIVDTVPYADEGDWAVRQRGILDYNHRGWTWYKPHDGGGASLELRNPLMPNEYGQNWGASTVTRGTPGRANSIYVENIAPLILNVGHAPKVPNSSQPVGISARILDEQSNGLTVTLFYRVDANPQNNFVTTPMFDDGAHRDGVADDGLYGAVLPAMGNNTIVEFYVEAMDAQGNSRTWPAPTIAAPDGAGPTGQAANALYQVDDNPSNQYGGTPSLQPVYKMIMTEIERAEMATMHSSDRNSDAQMNGTFVSHDGTGIQVRYLMSIRNRGHSTRGSGNYRLGFRSDDPWNGHQALIVNIVNPPLQVFGAAVAIKAGAVGAYDRAAQVRVNNVNRAGAGSPTFGTYSVNEVYDSDWADRQFPNDSGGNIYRVYRDIDPSELDYRGAYPGSYQNTYFKENNITENDWLDLINMHNVIGLSGEEPYSATLANEVLNVEGWLTHLAVMSLIGNSESGLNSGHNDDYFMYRGVNDPRFVPMFHDLDQLFGMGGQSFPDGPNDTIWGACYVQGSPTNTYQRSTGDNDGSGRALGRLMRTREFEQMYYSILQRLLDTTFSKAEFDALLDQTLTSWAPSVVNTIRNYMDARRVYVQGVISGHVPTAAPVATISGEPRSPTPRTGALLTVGGDGISHYRYRLNNASWSLETPVATPIQLSGLAHGSTNTVYVVGRTANNVWQNGATASRTWVILTNWPAVRLNEVLARNDAAVNYYGTYPDMVELYNESFGTVDLGGMRLTDDPTIPDQFVFPSGTLLASKSNLVVYANDPDGTPGLHLGFGLNQNGDALYLFDSVLNGGTLLDSVVFGKQVADRSIGRTTSGGEWVLGEPSFGAANLAVSVGNQATLKINEWLASGQFPYSDDFVEIYNPSALPVNLGGLYLTDSPLGDPRRHRIADLTFVDGNGFAAFIADGNTEQLDHLGFRLDPDIGEIALLTSSQARIDNIFYTPQQTGVSIGRCPDGGPTNRVQAMPSPGMGNVCPQPPPGSEKVTLMTWDYAWSYESSGSDLGTTWREVDYPDGDWPVGLGLLGVMRPGGSLPELYQTYTGDLGSPSIMTLYFRTHFTLPPDVNPTRIQLTHIIDDGMIVYLNGNEVLRYNLPDPPTEISNGTTATVNILDATYQGPTTIPLNYFVPGDNVLAVEVHQASRNSVDMILGILLEAEVVTNVASQAGIKINEIFANNATYAEPDGSTPDWVELYNPSLAVVDLAGTSLGDSSGNRWTFPSASVIPAQGYYKVRFDGGLPASETNTGFGLSATGDFLILYDKAPYNNVPLDTNLFGLQAADFSIGRVPSGSDNWTLMVPSVGGANIAAALGDPTRLYINEFMAVPASGDDWFEVYNSNEQPVAIGGMYFTDDLADPTKHKIAPLSFLGAQTNAWKKFIADGNVGAGADHVSFKLGIVNEAVGLADTNGLLIIPACIPMYGQQEIGVSRGRFPDGAGSIISFPGTASPGDPNFLLLPDVVVSEVLAHTDPPLEDAIELQNIGASPVNIGGWWLSDAKGNPRKFQIPANTVLEPGAFAVFYENQFNNVEIALSAFALSSAKGDEIYLCATAANGALNGYRALTEFGPSENGISFGRYQTSVGVDFTAMNHRSFGQDSPLTLEQFRQGTGLTNPYPKVGPVVISEIMYHPPDIGTNDNVVDEFVELRNLTENPLRLYDPAHPTNGWRLRKGVDFDFTEGTIIAPSNYLLVVSFDPVNDPVALAHFQATYGTNSALVGPYSGKLDNGGESIALLKPDEPEPNGSVPYIVVEQIQYGDRNPWPTNADGFGASLQRVSVTGYANDPTNWFGATPTPGPAGVSDRDWDGMPDWWETQYNLDPGNPNDAGQDADNDNSSNLQEFLAGTDPRNPDSYLKIAISPAGSQVRIEFQALAGKSYSIIYQTIAGPGGWTKLQDIAPVETSQVREVYDTPQPGEPQRFYRLVTPSIP